MRIAFLASRDSIHTIRWVNAMAARGHEVHVVTMHPGGDPLASGVQEHYLRIRSAVGYVANALQLRLLMNRLQPDLMHVQYASGYGTLARIARVHPYVLSVFGSDVYTFPYVSRLHTRVVRSNLEAADWLCSTSGAMLIRYRRTRRSDVWNAPPLGATDAGM